MLTWILGNFWSLPRGVSPRLEWGHAGALSSRDLAAVSRFPSQDQGICGFPSRLSHKAFPRGFTTGLFHVPPWCESILVLKVEAVQGKKFFPGVDRDIWVTLGMVARRWSSSRLSCEERLLLRFDGIAGNSFRPRRERIPPLELGVGNGAPMDVARTLVLSLKWRRVCRGTS